MIKPQSLKNGQWQKNEGGGDRPQPRPTAIFDILLAKYMEGRAGVRGSENWTIQNPKLGSPVSLSWASTFVVGSSSGKRSRTPQQQHSEGREHHHQDYHPVPHFSVGPPMPGPWWPPPMMFPPCPPWADWYDPWVPPSMHFHQGWSGPAQAFCMEATMQEMAATDTSTISRAEKLRGRQIEQSRMPN
jgi:hypothetical protein